LSLLAKTVLVHLLSGLMLATVAERQASAETATEASVEPASQASPLDEERDREKFRQQLRLATKTSSYFDLLASAMVGTGLRFNNPYRLPHALGESGESISSTPGYLDLALWAASGDPNGLQHGARLGWSVSLAGVPQQVVTPAYAALYRRGASWIFYGWAGLPFLAEPDFNVGAELALGATWMARAGIGLTGALVADGFYGAGTRETQAAFYPVLSGQLGLLVSYEVLP
jgi:hypothetical protein